MERDAKCCSPSVDGNLGRRILHAKDAYTFESSDPAMRGGANCTQSAHFSDRALLAQSDMQNRDSVDALNTNPDFSANTQQHKVF